MGSCVDHDASAHAVAPLCVVFCSTRKVGGGDGSGAADGKAGKGEGKGERKGEEKEETVTEVESYVPLKDLVSTRCVAVLSSGNSTHGTNC